VHSARKIIPFIICATALLAFPPDGRARDMQWRKKIKRARHHMLLFNTAVNNYYNAVLFREGPDAIERDRLINGSMAARQSINEISGCPDEYKRECEIINEIHELLRKMEFMAENRQVAFNQLEEQKELKKKVDGLFEELERLLKL